MDPPGRRLIGVTWHMMVLAVPRIIRAGARSLRISAYVRLALWRKVLTNERTWSCDEFALLLYCVSVLNWSAPL